MGVPDNTNKDVREILRQLHEIHQGAVHTNQNTSGTTVWLNHVVRNEIKCDIAH